MILTGPNQLFFMPPNNPPSWQDAFLYPTPYTPGQQTGIVDVICSHADAVVAAGLLTNLNQAISGGTVLPIGTTFPISVVGSIVATNSATYPFIAPGTQGAGYWNFVGSVVINPGPNQQVIPINLPLADLMIRLEYPNAMGDAQIGSDNTPSGGSNLVMVALQNPGGQISFGPRWQGAQPVSVVPPSNPPPGQQPTMGLPG